MENIKSVFQNGRETAAKYKDLNELIKLLETADHEFLSVAYEGASMEIALNDFTEDPSMKKWMNYLRLAENHAAQIFIGLGWAIAQEKKNELTFLKDLDKGMLFRMWDGCGYYDGTFRQRQVIKNQARLDYVKENDFRSYDEGLGRSMWYSSKGDHDKVEEIIAAFPPARQTNLWRGIGIACSYVGGCDENIFKTLISFAGQNKTQLGIGAAMVAKSRMQAGSITPDIEMACNAFCTLSAKEAMEITIKADLEAGDSFDVWLVQMESEIDKKERIVNKQ